jgi:hypothetical protein
MIGLFIGAFIHPAVLWLILFVIARHDADRSFLNLFFISLGVCFFSFILSLFNPWLFFIAAPAACLFALHQFCNLNWLRSMIAAILFTAWLFVWPILFIWFLFKLAG